jgi:hypothetical protein
MSIVAIARPCAVHHAADVAVERDVVEVELLGGELLGVDLGLVRKGRDVRVPVEGVVVEPHLGVEAVQTPALVTIRGFTSSISMSLSMKSR